MTTQLDAHPDLPSTRSRPVSVWLWAATAVSWAGVALVELNNLRNEGPLALVLPVVEILAWVAAVLATTATVRRVVDSRVATTAVLVVVIASATYLTNWSLLDARSYYATHQSAFRQVAALLDSAAFARIGDNAAPLPLLLQDVSTTGNAVVVGSQGGVPVWFLPQWLGIPDDAGGYVYFDGQPRSDVVIDLFGRGAHLGQGEYLSDGWWSIR